MIITVMRVMLLALWRDRGALMLAFGLPPLMFFVFAEVFSGAGDEDFMLRVALLDSHRSQLTDEVVAGIGELDGIQRVEHSREQLDGLEELVRSGQVDAALWLRSEPGADAGVDVGADDDNGAALLVIGDASRALAAAVLAGRVQRALQADFPAIEVARSVRLIETLSGPLSDERTQRLEAVIEAMRSGESSEGSGGPLVAQRLLGAGRDLDPGVSYYAAAVAILFLLFSAFQGAISLIDERTSGIHDRLMAGPGGIHVLILGKGLFLTLQGVFQAGLIFGLAWALYDLAWFAQFGTWLVTAALAAAVAAWGGLLLASVCTSRAQAQTASAFAVLLLSAVGGSMMPRFLMPEWLRELGWLTPNAWVIESWHDQFWRGLPVAELANAWGVLLAAVVMLMLVTFVVARRRMLAA